MNFLACNRFKQSVLDFAKRTPFVFSLALNSVVLLFCLFCCGGRHDSLDDYFMSAVLTGAYGSNFDAHLYFINAAYAYFLKPFYILFPSIGWYSVFESMIMLASFTAITYVLLKRCEIKIGSLLVILVLACASPGFYLHTSFTQCAGAFTAAGMLYLALGDDEKKKRYLFLGIFFVVGGFVMRKEMFLLGIPTLGVMLLWNLWQLKRIWKWTCLALVAGFILVAGLKMWDASLYKAEGYDYYAAYQPARAVFGDGSYYDFDALSDELGERGLASRDARYLKSWYFYDKDVFSLDSLNYLVGLVQRNLYEPNYVKFPIALLCAFAKNWMNPGMLCWIILSFLLLSLSKNKNYGFLPWVSLGLISMAYAYLLLVNRVVEHVVVCIWLYAVVFVAYFFNKEDILPNIKQRRILIRAILLVSFVGVLFSGLGFFYERRLVDALPYNKESEGLERFVQYTNEHSNDVFVVPFGYYKGLARERGNVFFSVEPGSWNNIFSTGYWNINFPAMESEMKKRGVANLFRDIINENVYVLADEKKMSFIPFYSDHYHKKLEADTLRTFGGLKLLKYRLRTAEK